MRASQRRVELGESNIDCLTAAGIEHKVIEVVRATDVNGVVTFTTPNMAATVRKGAGAPIHTTGDDLFGAFVIGCGEDLIPQIPTGVYEEGRIDVYEGIACSGECDAFTYRFWTEKMNVPLPSNWATLTFEQEKAAAPPGATWIPYTGTTNWSPWDIIYFMLPDDSAGHTGIVHSDTHIAHSNWLADGTGRYDNMQVFIDDGLEVRGVLRWSPATEYLIGVQHPTLGLRIQPAAPAEGLLNETFDLCWTCTVTLELVGVPVPLERVTLLGKRTTEDGDETVEIGGNRYDILMWAGGTWIGSGVYSGEWITDLNGVVRDKLPGHAATQLWFPKYPGNTRLTDLVDYKVWDGSAVRESDDYLTAVEVWYKGRHVSVSEGENVTFEVGGGSLQCNGTAGWNVEIGLWADFGAGAYRWTTLGTGIVGAGGSVTFPGLYPGRYVVMVWDAGVGNHGPRAYADVTANATTVHALGTPGNNFESWCYLYGATPAANCTVRTSDNLFGGTTDANGYIDSTLWGGGAYNNTAMVLKGGAWGIQEQTQQRGCYVLGGRYILYDESVWKRPWLTGWESDESVCIERVEDGATFSFTGGGAFGRLSEPLPRNSDSDFVPNPHGVGWWATPTYYHYKVKSGSATGIAFVIPTWGVAPGWPESWWHNPAFSTKTGQVIGSRIKGNITYTDEEQIGTGIDQHDLPEAARMGLERGKWQPAIAFRARVKSIINDGYNEPGSAAIGQVCPYCAGPAWPWPGRTSVAVFGYCTQCGSMPGWDIDATDCRTYYETPTIGAGSAKAITANWPPDIGAISRRELDLWYPPVEYDEQPAYVTNIGRGMNTNAPRWFVADDAPPAPEYHPRLAWFDGTFHANETADSIKIALDLPYPVYLRPKATVSPYTTHTGDTTYRATFTGADGDSFTKDFTIEDGTNGRGALATFEEIVFLASAPVINADEVDQPWPGVLLVTACTNIEIVDGALGNSVQIVADSPALCNGEPVLVDEEYTFEVLVVGPLWGEAGLHIAWHSVGATMLVTDTGLEVDAGLHKIQRGPGWSERFAVPDSDDSCWVNAMVTHARTELIEGQENVQIRHHKGLDGFWEDPAELEAEYQRPMGIAAKGALYVTALKDGVQYLLRRERGDAHAQLGGEAPLEIASGDDVPASLAFVTGTWALACAVQVGDQTSVYVSQDSGINWERVKNLAGLTYPAIASDGRWVWVVGYETASTGGAPGRVRCVRLGTHDLRTLPQMGETVTVGASDEGRPGILCHPWTKALYVVAPKLSGWTAAGPTPGIAEYRSYDTGMNWALEEVHPL